MVQRVILFSPVSDRDPCSPAKKRNDIYHDGALLHIVRHYHPEKVYLFLTRRFRDFEDKDHRFTKLLLHLNPNIQIEMIDCPDAIQNAAAFDQFDTPFHDHLERIHQDNPDAQLLVNVSSGTPQMQAALYLLAATLNFPVHPVQVMSPEKDSNAQDRYQFELGKNILVEDGTEYPDAEGNLVVCTENRCRDVQCTNAIRTVLTKNIQQLVGHYDYTAALDLYESSKELFHTELSDLLKTAFAHISLDTKQLKELERNNVNLNGFYEAGLQKSLQDTQNKQDIQTCYDYLLYMGTLIERGALNDFARAFSPALTKVMQLRLKAAGYDIMRFCYPDRNGIIRLSKQNIEQKDSRFLNYLNNQYRNDFRDGPLSALHMLYYMKFLTTRKKVSQDLHVPIFKKLRTFEEAIRNMAAHTITGITENQIRNITEEKLPAQEYLDLLKEEFQLAAGTGKLKWDALSRINQQIFDVLETPKI